MPMSGPRHRVFLLAGPSGSGKSHIAQDSGLPVLRLDDFYRDVGHPGLPRSSALGIVDWDHPDAWDADVAVRVIEELCHTGRADVPVYDLRTSRAVRHRMLDVTGAPVFVAEGLFAAELVPACRERGLLADAVVLERPTWHNAIRRLVRDLSERRKTPLVLVRRGWEQRRRERHLLDRSRALGARPASAAGVRSLLRTSGTP